MATIELDPVFVKALKLMQSKSKDSVDQLKQLLDEAVSQRKNKSKVSVGDSERSTSTVSHKLLTKQEEEKKREAEKRNVEKIKAELLELASEPKRPKLDVPSVVIKEEKADVTDKDKKDVNKDKYSSYKDKNIDDAKDVTSDSEDGKNLDADDFAFDLGISCYVCRSFDVSPGNQLVECLECHNLYHQDCHKPPITEQDINDPRFVWYCSRCSKSLKKMVHVAKPPKAKVALSASSSRETEGSTKTSKSPTPTPNPFQFRRSEPKLASNKESGNGAAAKPMSGFESLAANLSGRSLLESPSAKTKIEQLKQMSWTKGDGVKATSGKGDHSGGSKSESSSSGNKGAKSSGSVTKATNWSGSVTKATNWSGSIAMSAINAEKKLQFVKKRAAAKITDKKHYK